MKQRVLIKTILVVILILLIINISYAKEEQELRAQLLNLSSVVDEMSAADMGVARVNDLITEGFLYFNNNNFAKTKEIISSVFDLRDTAFETQAELALVNQLYIDFTEKNISLGDVSQVSLEWDLDYSQREFEKENYEGALKKLESIKKELISRISDKYNYLNALLAEFSSELESLGLSKARITTLQGLLSEALEKGLLDELEVLETEVQSLEKSLNLYQEINNQIPEIESKGLSSQRIKDGLESASLEMSFAKYDSAITILEDLKNLVNQAFELEKEITDMRNAVSEEEQKYETNFEEAKTLLSKANEDLFIGSYEEAGQKLEEAKTSYEDKKAGFLIGKAGTKNIGVTFREYSMKNWPYMLLVVFIILMVLKFGHRAISYHIDKKRLESMKKEIHVNEEMIKELQRNYFVKKQLSKESYDESYESLQEKIMSLREKISLLNKKIKQETEEEREDY